MIVANALSAIAVAQVVAVVVTNGPVVIVAVMATVMVIAADAAKANASSITSHAVRTIMKTPRVAITPQSASVMKVCGCKASAKSLSAPRVRKPTSRSIAAKPTCRMPSVILVVVAARPAMVPNVTTAFVPKVISPASTVNIKPMVIVQKVIVPKVRKSTAENRLANRTASPMAKPMVISIGATSRVR